MTFFIIRLFSGLHYIRGLTLYSHVEILDKTKENHSISYDKSLQGKCITVYGINKIIRNKMKNTKYLTVRTISKSNIKIVERGTINTTNTRYLL
jgi:hypothetical protein